MKKAAGIFFTDGKKVLLLKRAKGTNKNTWSLPGGKLEKNETELQAAIRESIEECGTIKGKKFDKIKKENWTTFFYKIKNIFKCTLSDEHNKWKWFDLDKLHEIKLHPKLKKTLDEHLQIAKNSKKNLNFKEWFCYHN